MFQRAGGYLNLFRAPDKCIVCIDEHSVRAFGADPWGQSFRHMFGSSHVVNSLIILLHEFIPTCVIERRLIGWEWSWSASEGSYRKHVASHLFEERAHISGECG